jgi:2-hydroxychromene-2-carboxylate isomerase
VARVEFFFDCSSPWTYLAFDRIEGLCAEADAELVWKPILVGGVFNSVNPSVYEQRAKPVPAKAHYYLKDLQDWARLYGLKIGQPPVFPVNSVKAMRGALVADDMRGALVADEHGRLPAWARAVFEAYWGQLLDISLDEVLAPLVDEVGLERDKARLRANTDELMRRGGFGSPTMFVDGDDMYFGNDRLPLIREALRANV